jgi:hypothetical protein
VGGKFSTYVIVKELHRAVDDAAVSLARHVDSRLNFLVAAVSQIC